MPPFRLEVIQRKPLDNRSKTTLYFKRTYSPAVKVTGWERYPECLPIDTDPYCPTAFNTHFSHYNQLGGDKTKVNYLTSTKAMLEQFFTRRYDLEINPNKELFNLYSNIEEGNCEVNKSACSAFYSNDYVTTMQHSYQPPYPFTIQQIPSTETPYFLHRRLKNTGICKFMDDDYIPQTRRLQKHKSHKFTSYNPFTGRFTDGSYERNIC